MASQGGFGRQCCFAANWFSVFVLVVTSRQPEPSVPDIGCGNMRFARFQKTPVLRYFSSCKVSGVAADPQCELQAKEQAGRDNNSLATPKSETRKIAAAIHARFSLGTRQVLSARNYSTPVDAFSGLGCPPSRALRVSNRGSYESRMKAQCRLQPSRRLAHSRL